MDERGLLVADQMSEKNRPVGMSRFAFPSAERVEIWGGERMSGGSTEVKDLRTEAAAFKEARGGPPRPEVVRVHAAFSSARYMSPKSRAFIDLAAAGFDVSGGFSRRSHRSSRPLPPDRPRRSCSGRAAG
jgi:hypothetical protein